MTGQAVLEAARYLIEKGAEVNQCRSVGPFPLISTPLFTAALAVHRGRGVIAWDGVSIRANSEQPRRGFLCGILQSVWAF